MIDNKHLHVSINVFFYISMCYHDTSFMGISFSINICDYFSYVGHQNGDDNKRISRGAGQWVREFVRQTEGSELECHRRQT